MPQSIRFSELVKTSGQPHAATLWTDPKQDSEFQKAIKKNRVLSVKQETVGTKKDFGMVGFRREKNVSYLIFPKSLPKTDSRVIGIKYDLLDQPKTKELGQKSKSPRPKAQKADKEFTATMRRTAVWEITLQVKAKSKYEAKKKLEIAMTEKRLPESDAIIRNELREIQP
jgi:hypothetical protein